MRTKIHLVLAASLLSVLAATGACRGTAGQAPQPGPIALSIRNNAFFDVVVYALPSTGIDSRVRLTTVTGHSSTQLNVARPALRADGTLVVYLHAIGSRYSWTSPSVMVDAERPACLDIFANPDGSLSRSSLYVMPGPITLGATSAIAGTRVGGATPEPATSVCGQ